MVHKTFYILATSLILLTANSAIANKLTVKLVNIEKNKGRIFIGVFNKSSSFPEGRPFKRVVLRGKSKTAKTVFKLKPGKYAVAIFQDRNTNNILDKNFLGIPKERYGFSGKKVFGKPSFKDASIKIKSNKKITIKLK